MLSNDKQHIFEENSVDKQSKYKVVFVLGNPGSGKNTQCDLIKEKFNFSHFSCGDLLRAEASDKNSKNGELINTLIKEGKIVPATITCNLAKKEMHTRGKENIYLIDGFPRNKDNLDGWFEVFGDESQILAVLHLDCSDEECTKRIKLRAQNSGRIDDNDESLKKRFNVFKEETIPNIENHLSQVTKIIKINTESSNREDILSSIVKELDLIINKEV
jgi:UMP-CMP kinase